MENPVILMFWVGTAVMLLAVLSIILLVALYHNKIRKMQQKETEWILAKTVATEKKERKRMAADLHDSVGGDLLAVNNFLSVLDNYIPDEEGKALRREVSGVILKTLSSLQQISYNLMPPDIEETGLSDAFREYFSRLRKTRKVTITEHYDGGSLLAQAAHQYELFRIVQEATGNLLRHGAVSKIKFTLSRHSGLLQIVLEDNGKPFDFYAALKENRGLGLRNMDARCRRIGARLTQESFGGGNRMVLLYDENKKTR